MSFSEKPDETSTDAIFSGAIMIRQSRRGYRFNVDSLLLADQVARSAPSTLVDLGSGTGVIALALAHRLPDAIITAIERQSSLLKHLIHNVAGHPRIRIIAADARTISPDAQVDVVVMNPPYYRPNSGRIPPNNQKADARHQRHGGISELLDAAIGWLHPGGSAQLSYPFDRKDEVLRALEQSEFGAVSLRAVESRAGVEPKVVLVTARRGPYKVTTVPPLVVYADSATYTQEASNALAGGVADCLRRR